MGLGRPLLPLLHHYPPAYTISRAFVSPFPPSSSSSYPPRRLSPSSSASPSAHFSSSSHRWQDHYKTLGVPLSASSREIKAHFYQLSRRYHPDLNKDDEGAKKKFQEVSEAWGVLGNERERRDYDRQLRTRSSSMSSSGRSGPMQNYDYNPKDNVSRRARATYAWEYQRRRGDSNRARAGQARSSGGDGREQEAEIRSAYARARGATDAGLGALGGGRSGGAERRLFEKYVAQQRRREEFTASRTSSPSGSGAAPSGEASGNPNDPFSPRVEDPQTHGESQVVRFIQVLGMLTFIFVAVSILNAGSSKLRAEGVSHEEQKERGKKTVVLPMTSRRQSRAQCHRLDDVVRR